MTDSIGPDATVELAVRHSTAKRVVLIMVGLAVIVLPVWDLWPGMASVSFVAPFFWVIGLGAVGIGLVLIGGSVFGWSTILTVSRGGVLLERENLIRRHAEPVDPSQIGEIRVEDHAWSDGPKTWRVSVAVKGRKPLLSDDFPSRAAAEALALRLARALGREPG